MPGWPTTPTPGSRQQCGSVCCTGGRTPTWPLCATGQGSTGAGLLSPRQAPSANAWAEFKESSKEAAGVDPQRLSPKCVATRPMDREASREDLSADDGRPGQGLAKVLYSLVGHLGVGQ